MSLVPKKPKEPIMRGFGNEEEMINHAESMYAKRGKLDAEKDREKGFDIDSMESIMAFEPGYTPLGNTVLCKKIPKYEDDKVGSIIVIDNSNKGHKYIVISPGINISILKKGDIIMLNGGKVEVTGRTFKEVQFEEIGLYDIAGILSSRGSMMERVEEIKRKVKEDGF